MVLRSFWRQNQLHGTHSFQENTILVNQFGWNKIIMAKIQCVLSRYCTSFHETIYKGTNTCGSCFILKHLNYPLNPYSKLFKTPKMLTVSYTIHIFQPNRLNLSISFMRGHVSRRKMKLTAEVGSALANGNRSPLWSLNLPRICR